MAANGGDLSGKQLLAIAALSRGSTVHEAAVAAGCGDRTVERWRTDPVFANEVSRATRQIYQDTTAKAVVAATKALQCLENIFTNAEQPATVRVSAAKAVLTHALANHQLNESNMEKRIQRQLEIELDLIFTQLRNELNSQEYDRVIQAISSEF